MDSGARVWYNEDGECAAERRIIAAAVEAPDTERVLFYVKGVGSVICPWCQESVDYSGENFCCAPRRERTLGTEMVFQKCPECNRTGYLKPSLCVRCKGTGIVGEWRECGGVSPAIEELLLF